MCDASQNRDTYIHNEKYHIIALPSNYILMLRARRRMAQKWQRTEREREKKTRSIYT
jgi:hypothetical protein